MLFIQAGEFGLVKCSSSSEIVSVYKCTCYSAQ